MNKNDRKIPIKNILHMFSYIWDRVESIDNVDLSANDDFDSVNIMSELFLVNINSILNYGLYKEYREFEAEIKGIRGKVNLTESFNKLSFDNAKAVCIYDELEVNNRINQIIKSTAYRLYKIKDLNDNNKKRLNNILLYMNNVDVIELSNYVFNISFNKQNYYCYYLILICKLIFDSTMLSEEKGVYNFINILDDDNRMNRVFELFVYKFYFNKLNNYHVSYQKKVNWHLNGGDQNLIPEMRLDILVSNDEEEIIIDTKYYKDSASTNQYSNKKTLISENMYQMYAYLNNYHSNRNIRGILLYPYNGSVINEDYNLKILNNSEIKESRLSIKTIDLSLNWNNIEENLIKIIH